MANKVYNLNGGLYSGNAFTAFEKRINSSGNIVSNGNDYKVTAGSGMTLSIAPGAAIIADGTLEGVRVGSDAVNIVTVSAASTANPRIDSVVMYVDKSVSPSASVVDNEDLGILKFAAVAGTPAATPSAPSTSTIQTAIGAGNPYMILAEVRVPASATAASSFTITDKRNTLTDSIVTNDSITTGKIADNAVTSGKIDWATFKFPTPDYSNGTTIPNSTNTWTATKPGIVTAVLVADTTNGYKNATISINGKVVAKSMWAGATGGYNFQTGAVVLVGTGDVVTFSATDGQSTVDGRVFYPYKWV